MGRGSDGGDVCMVFFLQIVLTALVVVWGMRLAIFLLLRLISALSFLVPSLCFELQDSVSRNSDNLHMLVVSDWNVVAASFKQDTCMGQRPAVWWQTGQSVEVCCILVTSGWFFFLDASSVFSWLCVAQRFLTLGWEALTSEENLISADLLLAQYCNSSSDCHTGAVWN